MGAYTSEARKAQYLTYRECGIKPAEAARRAGIAPSTTRDIWTRARELDIYHNDNGLPPPTIEETVAVKKKIGRPPVLSNEDCNKIFAACTKDKKSRKKQQYLIALNEGFTTCRRTIEL
jgi:hypothetical protein